MKNRTIPGFDRANITINGRSYTPIDPPSPGKGKRKLTFSLIRTFPPDGYQGELVEQEWQQIADRLRAFRVTFLYRFPEGNTLRETSHLLAGYSEYTYTLPDAQEVHISWARMARDIGLIDSFTVDYGS